MRSPGVGEAPNTIGLVTLFLKRWGYIGTQTHTGRIPFGNVGREQSDAFTSQGSPATAEVHGLGSNQPSRAVK